MTGEVGIGQQPETEGYRRRDKTTVRRGIGRSEVVGRSNYYSATQATNASGPGGTDSSPLRV